MWRGAIQFGLVTIPVKLYLATESSGIGFNMLHASCLNRIQMKIYCPFHDEVVPRSETVRGYEWSKGRYVVVTDDDLEAVPLKTVRSIEIAAFVDADQEAHGAEFVKSAYYLEPDPVGKKARFLSTAIAATGLQATVEAAAVRAEALAVDDRHRGRWPAVTARAVGSLPDLVELAFPLLRPGGVLVAWKRGDIDAELAAAESAAVALGGGSLEIRPVDVAGLHGHCLVLATARGRVPDAYPRDPAVRRRRPWSKAH